ncbi:hypothetical protein [Nocardia lijiangensis]|uniref:hypothetical protein n=1 Tax=Nocardia lijiangensis TaxID=299618 RepID=UPI00082C60D0|nr:hypothetical protein [Nocardia lijiangensis]
MVAFVFSVDDDPQHSGFSLGHLDVCGSAGRVTTRGRQFPDERMMVYPSALLLLAGARILADRSKGQGSFEGIDSTFTLRFALQKGKVETWHGRTKVDVSCLGDFLDAVRESAKTLYALGAAEIEEDPKPMEDLARGIAGFEAWQAARS